MRRTFWIAFLVVAGLAASTQAQVGSPGIEYGTTIAAGDGVQLYPYDQQDTWLHGHFQRVPSYGGFASFRPYNYRHVFTQTQLAQQWGHAHGMPYSQQFWNRYRGSYLDGNLHSDYQPMIQNPQTPGYSSQMDPTLAYPQQQYAQPYPTQIKPIQGVPNNAYPVSAVRPIGFETQEHMQQATRNQLERVNSNNQTDRPVHVFPEHLSKQ
jgi:hypothetical protein